MPRFIREYAIDTAGDKLLLPVCSRFLGAVKSGRGFLLILEVWGDPSVAQDVVVSIFRKDEYISSNANIIGYTLVGSDVYYFSYILSSVEDTGGDGGAPKTPIELKSSGPVVDEPSYVFAGGMSEC